MGSTPHTQKLVNAEIRLKKIWHRGQYRIGIFFDKKEIKVRQRMKYIGARFSRTKRCWHLVYNKANYQLLKHNFSNIKIADTRQNKSANISTAQASAYEKRQILPIAKQSERPLSYPEKAGSPRWINVI